MSRFWETASTWTAPAKNIEYVASLALACPVKQDKAEAVYEHGLLRIEVPFKDPMEDAVKVAIKTAGAESKPAAITVEAVHRQLGAAATSRRQANLRQTHQSRQRMSCPKPRGGAPLRVPPRRLLSLATPG